MDEYISREAVLNLIEHNDKVCHYADERYKNVVYATTQTICKVVAEMPAADVQPVRCGEWEIIFPQNGKPKLKCTNCHSLFDIRTNDKHTCIYPKFCEECGADMRGEKNE